MALPQGAYNPRENEEEMLDYWLSNKLYKPEYNPETNSVMSTEEMKKDPREPWALICPPPNAYARPHIGNISGYAYQDAMARYARMQGKKVLVLPGKDHAGLEGEGVFVREVLEKKGINKFDLEREEFYKQIMQFFHENMDIALKDEKNIGLSADFDRDTFTLDPDIVETVLDTFVEMYNKGMIYKGVRIINYDIKARTAVADNQIEYKDSVTPFFYFKYAFTKPEEKAVELKNTYTGKRVEWRFERSKTSDGKNELPFEHGFIKDTEIPVIGIGFKRDAEKGTVLEGKAIGIHMSLDNNFKIVVLSDEFNTNNDSDGLKDENLKKEIFKIFQFEAKYYPGSHIILFADYPEDKYYTNGFILGTVRPETKFGDTALAVNEKDTRYKEWIGKTIEVQTLNGPAKLHIIADYSVDPEFGTGVVKVTPAHSPIDWEVAQRHPKECLPAKQVIGYDLKLNHLTGKYAGMTIKEAREAMKTDLKENGMLIHIDENYQNRIMIAERTKAPIEPLLSSQWYLKYDGIKEAAIEMVKNGTVKIHPKNMEDKFFNWMENLRDWAISRSLWWGYRLPVWYHGDVKEEIGQDGQVRELIKLSGSEEWIPLEYNNPDHLRVQKDNPGNGWIQDDNVLDTWFSSGQWPYATLMKYGLMDTFYPTDALVSAADILENWDSRMMMFSYFKTGKEPFKNLYLTGLVLGKDGQKMSKSRGNIVDNDKVVEQYGVDALRMTYFYQNSAGGSYVVSDDKLKNFKNFNNKIWNASKFVMMNLEGLEESDSKVYDLSENNLKIETNRKLFNHIKEIKEKITKNIDNYEFGYATESLYDSFWHMFCDICIEEAKPYVLIQKDKETGEIINQPDHEERKETQRVLLLALKEYMKMLHPFIPHITERIWRELPKESSDHESLMYTRW